MSTARPQAAGRSPSAGRIDEPLLFERIFLEKVWGGRALERALGIALPQGQKIGETWEISDRTDRNSVVARGRLRGRTLRELMSGHREEILGRGRPAPDGSFPLLVKFLDATQHLSVQVHPHRGIAHTLPPGDSPKTECWYVLAAEPSGGIWHGLRPNVDVEKLAAEAAGPGIVPLLSWYRAEPGQFYFVPGGTVHSIGAGVTLIEIQETSDTTYRLYDWGRTQDGRPREMHVERGLRAVRQTKTLQKPRRPYRRGIAHKDDSNKRARCVDGDEFSVDLLELAAPLEQDTKGVAVVYVMIEGKGRIASSAGGEPSAVAQGEAWMVPACLGAHRIEPDGALRLLQVRAKA